jgi:uncharacterized YigZ family protein
MEPHSFFTIDKPSSAAEFKDRGSSFIGYAFPVQNKEEVKAFLNELKKLHPKAAHHCYAYRLGLTNNEFRAVDDGEPSGSAGKPILGQIDSKELTNTLVVVVRYFGGSLLGVPGLINAYKTSASLCLQMTNMVQKQIEVIGHLEFDYTLLNDVMLVVKIFNCTVIKQEQTLFCHFTIGIPKENLDKALSRFKDLYGVALKLEA